MSRDLTAWAVCGLGLLYCAAVWWLAWCAVAYLARPW